jgi:hypothetical protein
MRNRLGMGLVLMAFGAGCGTHEKHETSAPHTTISLEVRGENSRDIPADRFEDGWSVHFSSIKLAPTFGVDEALDHRKANEAALMGVEGYPFGGMMLELTSPEPRSELTGWVLAGHSTGWGMSLRRVVTAPERPEAEAALEVTGSATAPDGRAVQFAWRFATEMTFAHCVPRGESSLILPEDGRLDVAVTLDVSTLFGSTLAADAPLEFGPIAQADGDGDDTLTTGELRESLLSNLVRADGQYAAPGATTLHDFLTARLAYVVGKEFECQVTVDACQDRLAVFGACDDTDLADKDHDGDGTRNCMDDDIDGDGLDNAADCDPYHGLASLSACDDSDQKTKDSDQDGLRNCEDPDIDGDGLPNESDGRPYRNVYSASKAESEATGK